MNRVALGLKNNVKLHAFGQRTNIFRCQKSRCRQSNRSLNGRDDRMNGPMRGPFSQTHPRFVINIDYGVLQLRPIKKNGFSLLIGCHIVVIVQVVAREIGEYGHIKTRGLQSPLLQTDGTCFKSNGFCTDL